MRPGRNEMSFWKIIWVLSISIAVFFGWSQQALTQHDFDYVPGMEKFPDIDIRHYDLCAEFHADETGVKAKAIVDLMMKEESDYIVFEIDRRVKISSVNDGHGNFLRFKQPDEADCVEIYLAYPVEKGHEMKVALDYVCNFPPLQEAKVQNELDRDFPRGSFFFLRKWYPVNDYFCDQATAEFAFTVPKDYEVLTSGAEVSVEILDNSKLSLWRSFGSSSVYFVFAGPFIKYAYKDQEPEILVFMDKADRIVANIGVQKALDILRYYKEILCPYPYPVLYLVTTRMQDALGLNGLTHIDYQQFSGKFKYSDWTWSHELAHHWFGGIINARSPEDYCFLIECPAEYISRLYIRSTKGEEQFRNDLEVQRMVALSGYEIVPITKYYTQKRGGDFLYAKGFYVLHMLRNIMGDHKFFGMMKKLIKKFYMKQAEIRDLQKMAEQVCGKSLSWFFDQWVFGKGIPEYEFSYRIDSEKNGKYEVTGNIKQKLDNFRLPVEILAVNSDFRSTLKLSVEHQENPFRFEIPFKPDGIFLDPEFKILRWDGRIKILLYTSQARKLNRAKKYREAEKLLDRALALGPQSSWAAFERASVAFALDQYESTVKYCMQALKGDLDFHMIPWSEALMRQVILLLQGMSYDLLGERQNAMTCYKKVIVMGRNAQYPRFYDQARQYLEKPASKDK
jgi:hypothetical protein